MTLPLPCYDQLTQPRIERPDAIEWEGFCDRHFYVPPSLSPLRPKHFCFNATSSPTSSALSGARLRDRGTSGFSQMRIQLCKPGLNAFHRLDVRIPLLC